MKTLVYFASGRERDEYQNLDFDKIYLVDNCFKGRNNYENRIVSKGKITLIGMDCLESIEFLKKEGVKIDCFVSLNEGLDEGGGHYAINSDMFLGYVMPLLNDDYIHIMNKKYYRNRLKVSMDLPYQMEEIKDGHDRFLNPFIFSKDDYHEGNAKVYHMTKTQKSQTFEFGSSIKLSIVHDSIWNYYEMLDVLAISITQQGQQNFFEKLPKVLNIKQTTIDDIFNVCVKNRINIIGFTPWAYGNYKSFIEKITTYDANYPKEIMLFHLNKNDFKQLKIHLPKLTNNPINFK